MMIPDNWQPTKEKIDGLPGPIRNLIFGLTHRVQSLEKENKELQNEIGKLYIENADLKKPAKPKEEKL